MMICSPSLVVHVQYIGCIHVHVYIYIYMYMYTVYMYLCTAHVCV